MPRKKGNRTIKGNLIVSYLEEYPKMANYTLAHKIYEENPDVFGNINQVRKSIGYYKGTCGAKLRQYADKEAPYYKGVTWENEDNNHVDESIYVPYTLPTGDNNILVLSDIHLPYQDNKALKAAINYGRDCDVNTIILNGDTMDMYEVSDFIKHPNKPSVKYEIDYTKKFLRELRDTFPHARIYFKTGNHEDRWYRYLLKKAPVLYDLQILELDDIIGMSGMGIKPITNNRRIIAGDLNIFHGHEIKVSSQNYPAAALYRKVKGNALCGHLHRPDHFSEMDINRNVVNTYVTGCLCTLLPEYAIYNRWQHGFAHVKISEGISKVNNIIIKDGRI